MEETVPRSAELSSRSEQRDVGGVPPQPPIGWQAPAAISPRCRRASRPAEPCCAADVCCLARVGSCPFLTDSPRVLSPTRRGPWLRTPIVRSYPKRFLLPSSCGRGRIPCNSHGVGATHATVVWYARNRGAANLFLVGVNDSIDVGDTNERYRYLLTGSNLAFERTMPNIGLMTRREVD